MVVSAKGTLYGIGGHEDRDPRTSELEVLKHFFNPQKPDSSIQIVTTATLHDREGWEPIYRPAFEKVGYRPENIHFSHIGTCAEANEDQHVQKAINADAVMFTGGAQEILVDCIMRSRFYKVVSSRYQTEPDFVVAGTSAGAAAFSKIMVVDSVKDNIAYKGNMRIGTGFGFVPENISLDTHFHERERWGRMPEVVLSSGVIGIGLGENTGICYRDNKMTVIGSGKVTIMDGSAVTKTNIHTAQQNEEITSEGMQLFHLAKGDIYYPAEKKILAQHIPLLHAA